MSDPIRGGIMDLPSSFNQVTGMDGLTYEARTFLGVVRDGTWHIWRTTFHEVDADVEDAGHGLYVSNDTMASDHLKWACKSREMLLRAEAEGR